MVQTALQIAPEYRGINSSREICPTSIGKPCPICEFRAMKIKEGEDPKSREVKDLKASVRNLYAVVPKGSKDYEEEPHIWDISQYCFQDALDEELEEGDGEFDAFPDFEMGNTLQVRFAEDTVYSTKFNMTSRIDFTDRDEQYDEEEILGSIPCLDDVLKIKSYKELEALFYEMDDESGPGDPGDDDDDDDEPEKEKSPRRKKTTSKKKEPEPDEDEDDDDDEEPDDEDTDGRLILLGPFTVISI